MSIYTGRSRGGEHVEVPGMEDQRTFVSFSFDDLLSMVTFWGTDHIQAHRSFVYQQYTGLNDKHGKEIYAYDILQEDLRRRYLVAWLDNGWALREVGDLHAGYRHFKDAQHMEVIGNSDEHPELVQRPSNHAW